MGDTDDEEAVLDLEDDEADDSDADLEAGGQLSKGEPAACAHHKMSRHTSKPRTGRMLSAGRLPRCTGATHAVHVLHACATNAFARHSRHIYSYATLGSLSCVLAVQ